MMLELRTIGIDERPAFARSASIPFLELGDTNAVEHWDRFLEPDRTWVVTDGGRFVANCCVFSRDLTLPANKGDACPTVSVAAVSGVGVHPTHRRRGLLGQMMATMLDDARHRGEPMAVLVASEATIYGRFGFGVATLKASVTIDPGRSGFLTAADPLELIVMESNEAATVVPPLFERLRRTRAGQINRDGGTWADIGADPEARRQGATACYWAVGEEGYVSWRANESTVTISDLYGATSEIEASLWRFVLDLDLIERVVAPHRPVDDAIGWRLADPRRWQMTALADLLWVRVLDVSAVLEARRYGAAARVVLEVTPPSSGSSTVDGAVGRFVLDAGPDGASCRPATRGERSDLRIGVAELGSLILGGVQATTLGASGRILEEVPGALTTADRLFATSPAPFTGTEF